LDCRPHRRAPADQQSKGPELKDSTRRTLRTIFQAVIGLAAGMPLIVETSGVPATSGAVAVTLAVSAAVTRVMALPVVDNLLPSWLRK
jgi:hypothetical protein